MVFSVPSSSQYFKFYSGGSSGSLVAQITANATPSSTCTGTLSAGGEYFNGGVTLKNGCSAYGMLQGYAGIGSTTYLYVNILDGLVFGDGTNAFNYVTING